MNELLCGINAKIVFASCMNAKQCEWQQLCHRQVLLDSFAFDEKKKFEPAKNRGLRAHDWLTIEFLNTKALTLMKYDPNDRKQLLLKTHEKLNALLKTIRQ